jgi:uncharacterized membrane protein (UPF0127 family)
MNGLRLIGLLLATAAVSGCDKPSPVSAGPSGSATAPSSSGPGATTQGGMATAAASQIPGLPTKAQPKLSTVKLWLGAEELITEMAISSIEQETGMMYRTNMAENEAMIFVMPFEQQASFWMPNCPLPLSVAYINTDGVIQEIHPLQPYNTNSVFSAAANIRFALETPQGWFDRHHISTGAVVRTERGSLKQTFLERR